MAYRPSGAHRRRDKAYPSEIAAMRPMLAPRIHCEEPYEEFDGENSIRGTGRRRRNDMPMPPDDGREPLEDVCERFNHSLRSGHGFRNEGEDNE